MQHTQLFISIGHEAMVLTVVSIPMYVGLKVTTPILRSVLS